ncbi:MAG: aldehyde dehydrogenase family protein, partial [Verrucomicrobiae bacterium]|nr:aldehyde dehydrogenase family protein [Verrucomicrobiae bacterium]
MNSPAYTSDAERCFLRALNPTTGEELDPVFECTTPYELDRLVRKSAEAFEVYSAFPGKQRQRLLETIAFHLESNARPIIERAHAETGLPMSRLEAEMARTCFQLRFLGSLVGEGSWVDARIDHGDATRKPQPKPDVRSMFRPVGPVAVFGAANFPLAFSVAGGDTASALAAGNTVLFKVHPGHPGTSELVGQAICRALKDLQMPDSTFALLFDTGGDIGGALVKHPLVKAVGFTGSRRVARMLMDIAASRPEPIPVFAEMGSVNPIFILPDAMSKRAAEIADGVHASVTLGVGQFCTKPGLVILQAGPGADTFKNRLAELISATPAGVMLTPAIQKTFQTGIESLKSIKGVSLVAHGKT